MRQRSDGTLRGKVGPPAALLANERLVPDAVVPVATLQARRVTARSVVRRHIGTSRIGRSTPPVACVHTAGGPGAAGRAEALGAVRVGTARSVSGARAAGRRLGRAAGTRRTAAFVRALHQERSSVAVRSDATVEDRRVAVAAIHRARSPSEGGSSGHGLGQPPPSALLVEDTLVKPPAAVPPSPPAPPRTSTSPPQPVSTRSAAHCV